MNEEDTEGFVPLERYREQLLRQAELLCRDPLHELKALRDELLKRPMPKREEQPPGEHAPGETELAARIRRGEKAIIGAYKHPAYKHAVYGALDLVYNAREPERGELLGAMELLYAEEYEEHYLHFRKLFAETSRSEHYESPTPEDLEALEQALPLARYFLTELEEGFFVFALWPLRELIEGSWWHDEESWPPGLQGAATQLLRVERKLAALGYGAEKEAPEAPAELY